MNEAKYFTDQGKIICQVCHQTFQVIGATHLKKHNMTMIQYKEKFPNAPVSSKAFNAKSKLKHLNLEGFGQNNKTDDFKLDVKEPSHKEIVQQAKAQEKVPKPIKKSKPHMFPAKGKIIQFLKSIYSTVKENQFIEKSSLSGILEYSFVSDIIDLESKIDFEFTNANWHNTSVRQDKLRDHKLKEDGWTIIRINHANPTINHIKDKLDIVY